MNYPRAWYSSESSEERTFLNQALSPEKPRISRWDTGAVSENRPPRAGTVSHHLLASWYIDKWFSTLAQSGEYQTFFILSPRHYHQGSQGISLSPIPWDSGIGPVPVDPKALTLKKALSVPWDPWAFHKEHGIGTLMPFIKKYFPQGKIIPVVLQIEDRDLDQLKVLAREITQILKADPKSFLIISTDFSHHADLPTTQARDRRTQKALQDLNSDSYLNTYSDNVSGFAVLGWVLEALERTRGHLWAQADSYELTGLTDDITSYFFTFY